MKKLWILSMCLCLVFALTACQQEPEKKDGEETDAKTTTTTTTTVANIDENGTGGDMDGCVEHQFYYHAIDGDWTQEQIDAFQKAYEELGEPDDGFNIVEFVKCLEIPREDFPRWAAWTTHETWDGDLDKPALAQWRDCPYTYNQFLDAVYGDDQALAEWVFAYETTCELGHY